MKNNIRAVIVVASMFVASSAMAQKGMWELSAAANIESSSSTVDTGFGSSTSDQTQTFIAVDVGRYFTPKLVGRVSVSMFGSDDGAGNSSMGTTIGAGVKNYFGEPAESKWVPFVQGGINIVLLDMGTSSASGIGFVGGGGVSHFLTEEVSLDLTGQLFYNYMTMDSPGNPTLSQSGIRFLAGVSARF